SCSGARTLRARFRPPRCHANEGPPDGRPLVDARLLPRSLRLRRSQAARQRAARDVLGGCVALATDVHGYRTGLAIGAADLDLGRRLAVGLGVLDDRAAGIRAELGAGP